MSYVSTSTHYVRCDNCGKMEQVETPSGNSRKSPWRRLYVGRDELNNITSFRSFRSDFPGFNTAYEFCCERCEKEYRVKLKAIIKKAFEKRTKDAYKILDGIHSVVGQGEKNDLSDL